MSDYTVIIVRADADDRAWSVAVRERPGWHFREKEFSSIDARVRAIAQAEDGDDPSRVKIIYGEVRVGTVDITHSLQRLMRLRLQAQEVGERIDTTTDELIALLRQKASLTTRDTASIVGLSHTRVHQRERSDRAPGQSHETNEGAVDE